MPPAWDSCRWARANPSCHPLPVLLQAQRPQRTHTPLHSLEKDAHSMPSPRVPCPTPNPSSICSFRVMRLFLLNRGSTKSSADWLPQTPVGALWKRVGWSLALGRVAGTKLPRSPSQPSPSVRNSKTLSPQAYPPGCPPPSASSGPFWVSFSEAPHPGPSPTPTRLPCPRLAFWPRRRAPPGR